MNKIEVIIPTRNRLEKLDRCLDTIPRNAKNLDIKVTIVCDGDAKTASALIGDIRVDRVIYIREHVGSVFARNVATQAVEGHVICAVDDMVFMPGAIEEAHRVLMEKFPDGDGVVGFFRADRDYSKMNISSGMYAGVALIGQKFLRRYPNQKLFCPEYFLFAAQEVTNLGNKLGKICVADNAKMFHHAPRKGGGMDQTHVDGRQHRLTDRATKKRRAESKILWGDNNG